MYATSAWAFVREVNLDGHAFAVCWAVMGIAALLLLQRWAGGAPAGQGCAGPEGAGVGLGLQRLKELQSRSPD